MNDPSYPSSFYRSSVPILVSMLLLGAVFVQGRQLHGKLASADEYHLTVRGVAASQPIRVGMWYGTDTPVTPAAVALLHPNLILSRSFRNMQTGQQVTFLLVQCVDARDILGHYPPVCYAGQGWENRQDPVQRDLHVNDLTVHGTEYRMASNRVDRMGSIIIYNFMILPNGSTCPDMAGVDAFARNRLQRAYGAAQVQFVFDSNSLPEEREEFLKMLVTAYRPLIDSILGGSRHG